MRAASAGPDRTARRAPPRALLIVAAGLCLCTPAQAGAQELGVTAEVSRPIARTGGEDPSAAATEVDARRRPRPLDTLEDAILEAPGARPLRTGGYGSASTLSLRGADADQVEVLLGDVPLSSADGGAFDLSSIPLWALERVEIYRGGAPTWFGTSAIGGVLRLVPRRARETRFGVTLGAASFGLAQARGSASVAHDDIEWHTSVGVSSSEGDFPVLDDGRTAFDPSDDADRARRNAWLRQGSGLANLRLRVGDGHLSLVLLGLERLGGIPGPASQPTQHARRHETSTSGTIAYDVTDRGRRPEDADWRLSASLAAGYRRRRLTDRFAEVGLVPRATDDHAARVSARVAFVGRALPWLELTGVGVYTHETLQPSDALARQRPDGSARDSGSLGLEGRAHGRASDVRFELRPSGRLTVIGSRLTELRADRIGDATSGLVVAPSGRIGGVLEPTPGVAISASYATGVRPPHMVELFGDRAFLLGDTRLRPETSHTVDLGVALAGREGVVSGRGELRGFATFTSDLIRYRRNSRFAAVPENVASATLAGAELGVRGEITRHVSVRGALTFLESWTEHLGRTRRLPLRPWMSAYVRIEARAFELGPLQSLGAFVDLAHTSETFFDAANTAALPARSRLGLGVFVSAADGHIRLDAWVRDVLDARGVDLLGFPLPGRSFGLTASVR